MFGDNYEDSNEDTRVDNSDNIKEKIWLKKLQIKRIIQKKRNDYSIYKRYCSKLPQMKKIKQNEIKVDDFVIIMSIAILFQ